MADKITRNYNMAVTGVLSVEDDGKAYISLEDGPQDVNVSTLLADFNGKSVKLTCTHKSEYIPEEEQKVDTETGEIIDL